MTSKEFIGKTSFEEVYRYYIEENHSKKQCYDYFNVTERIFRAFLEYHNIKKPRALAKILADNSKYLRYGDANYNNHEKYEQTCIQKYGVTSALADPIIHAKTIATQQYLYGGTGFATYSKEDMVSIAKKANSVMWHKYHTNMDFARDYQISQCRTKKLNKSFNTSKKEQAYYVMLCNKYGKENVVTQYYDLRYPFKCDFYIKTEDLFIELNAHWTHGSHPFNKNDPQDRLTLEKWKQKAKNSKYFENAIQTWTVRDVSKLNCLKNNNLNYLLVYNGMEVSSFDCKN